MKMFLRALFGCWLIFSATVASHAQVLTPVLITQIVQPVQESGAAGGPFGVPVPLQVRSTGTAVVHSTQFFVNDITVTPPIPHAPGLSPQGVTWLPPRPGAYFITAITVDSLGNVAKSLPVRYYATGTEVNSPESGTLVPIGSSVVLKADATTFKGFIRDIEFFVNGASIGIDRTFPYSIIYKPDAGLTNYLITAVATDNNNIPLAASTPLTLTGVNPIGSPPIVSVASPAHLSAVRIPDYTRNGSIPISVIASDGDGRIDKVELYVDGVPLEPFPARTFPYSWEWKPAVIGTYEIVALAFDDKNNAITSTPNRVVISAPPSVNITSPGDGSALPAGAPVTVTANASDSDGSVISVQFFADNVLIQDDTLEPFAVSWVPVLKSDQDVELTALATDNFGITTLSRIVSVKVTGGGGGGGASIGQPPSIVLSNPPANNRITVGQTINLTASANDSDGNILVVQFFANGQSVGSDNTFPYSANWTPVSLGAYAIQAKALDNDGNVMTTTVPVTVVANSSGLPQVTILSPVTGSRGTVGAPVALAASAVDSDGLITSVEFFVSGKSVGSTTAFPHVVGWIPTTPGTYAVTAAATDDGGNRVVSTVSTITVAASIGNLPLAGLFFNDPTRSATTPPSTETTLKPVEVAYGSKLILSAEAADEGGSIASVAFYFNGRLLTTLNAEPYYTVTSLDTLADSIVTAVVTDNSGNVTYAAPLAIDSFATNGASALEVKLSSPLNGSTYGVGSQIVFAASHNAGNLPPPVIDFYVNGAIFTTVSGEPFNYQVGLTRPGTYDIHAVLRSGNRTTVSQPSRIVVRAGTPPVVTMTAPTNGSTVGVGTGVALKANATDADGTITSVQFFANGTAIGGPDSQAPYTVNFTPTSAGVYRFTALALDSSSQSTVSAAVTVLVTAAEGASSSTESVYSGSYFAGSELGRISVINTGGGTSVAIAQSTTGTPKFYFYQGLTVDVANGFSLMDTTGASLISGRFSDTGASGSFDGGRASFISPLTFAASTSPVPTGLYTGNLTGRLSSTVVGIVGQDGVLAIYLADGASRDAGYGSVSATGAFSFVLSSGARVAGTINPTSRFLSGTVTGGSLAGAFTGAASTGASFSDGVLRNLSTRGFVGAGDKVLVAGFVVGGSVPKKVLVRAIGPSLGAFNVSGVLANPLLNLYRGASIIESNDNWGGNAEVLAASTQVGAFPLTAGSLDSALLVTLSPGIYTAVISGVNAGTGVALVEVYDVDVPDPFTPQKVLNLSTRGEVLTGDRMLIAGFVVNGSSPKKVLVRAVGPTLGGFGVTGVLADPILRIVQGTTVVRENDNWEAGNNVMLINEAASKAGAFALPTGSKDAAVLLTLPPGTYSAQVTGTGTTTGVSLVEVYEVP